MQSIRKIAPALIVLALLIGVALVIGLLGGGDLGQQNAPGEMCWQTVVGPGDDSDGNSLMGIAAVSASDVWAVGSSGNVNHPEASKTLVEHWDGATWTVVASPNPGTGGALNGVAAVSANDIWAVGSYFGTGNVQTLVEHWDGSAWTVVASPNPNPNPATGFSYLWGVAAVTTSDIWAVGSYSKEDWRTGRPLVEHWDGKTWTVVSSPDVGAVSDLRGVAAVSANDVWAVGSSGLYDEKSGTGPQTLVEHWNGSAWTVVTSPSPGTGGNHLWGVAAVSANDIWAVGQAAAEKAVRSLIMHWNGTAWAAVAGPKSGASYLHAVAATSAGDVWAVGNYSEGPDKSQPIMQHWNGTEWTAVPAASSSAGEDSPYAVAAVSASDVWAVGTTYESGRSATRQALIERYAPCGSVPVTPSATVRPTNTPPADGGPNAGLSNEELLTKALDNMKTLKSYWTEFEGLKPAGSADPTTRMTMSGYELPGKGLKLTLTGERTTDLDTTMKSWTILDIAAPLSSDFGPGDIPLPGYVDVVAVGTEGYFSLDGGRTWRSAKEISPFWFLLSCDWNPQAWGGGDQSGPLCGTYVNLLKSYVTDADPRTEAIDGVPVRHLTVDLMAKLKEAAQGYTGPAEQPPMITQGNLTATRLEVWVSTDATPRIMRTRYDIAQEPSPGNGEEPTPTTNVTYSLDWKWSRFNEQFEEIKAPVIAAPGQH